jgi:ABC-type transport system involved in multi-copper enzyme maturation permease subunit
MQIWALIYDSFREALDRKVFWIMLLMSVVIAGALGCVGFGDEGVDFMFGTWTIESSEWSTRNEDLRSMLLSVVIASLADQYLGWVGIMIGLVATSTAFPSLMEAGNIDLVASKPINRNALFLGRYAGAMVFILLQATVFVGLTFVVMGVRWGIWAWGYLWLIPLMVLLFSYVYAFLALFGVLTKHSITSLMLAVVAWFVIFLVQQTYNTLATRPELDVTGRWTSVARTMNWCVPKTRDIPVIGVRLMTAHSFDGPVPGEGAFSESDRAELRETMRVQREFSATISAWSSIGSSLASEAVVVMVAMWFFRRRDF